MSLPQHSSLTNEHYTPPVYLEAVRAVFDGPIDYDPASCSAGNLIVRARSFDSAESNGYSKSWQSHRNIFVNPPGGRMFPSGVTSPKGAKGTVPSASAWWKKATNEWYEANLREAGALDIVFLAFSIELLQTAQQGALLAPTDFPICYPKSRIAFINEDGHAQKGNTHASAFVCMSATDEVIERFEAHFALFGKVVVPRA